MTPNLPSQLIKIDSDQASDIYSNEFCSNHRPTHLNMLIRLWFQVQFSCHNYVFARILIYSLVAYKYSRLYFSQNFLIMLVYLKDIVISSNDKYTHQLFVLSYTNEVFLSVTN